MNSLLDLEDIQYFENKYKELESSILGINNKFDETLNVLDERIGTTLKLTLDGYGRLVSLLRTLHDNANTMTQEEFVLWLNTHTDAFDIALAPLDEILKSWPEYISSTKKEESDGNNTQIQ